MTNVSKLTCKSSIKPLLKDKLEKPSNTNGSLNIESGIVSVQKKLVKQGDKKINPPLGYERVYLPLCELADTPFHILGLLKRNNQIYFQDNYKLQNTFYISL